MAGNLFQGIIGLSAGTVTTAPIPPVEQNNELLQSLLIEQVVTNKLLLALQPSQDALEQLRTDTASELLNGQAIIY